ncbi:unnamed protein product [Boreogadus saida]
MGRFRVGQKKRAADLWQKAGGTEVVLRSFLDHRFTSDVTSEQWSSVSVAMAIATSGNSQKWLKWLRVIWKEDRRGVRTAVLHICSMFCSAPGAPPSAPPSPRYLAPAVAFKAWEALFTRSLARASTMGLIRQSL